MIIENITWREVVARHVTSKKEFAGKTDHLAEAAISLEGSRLSIIEVNAFNSNRSWLYNSKSII